MKPALIIANPPEAWIRLLKKKGIEFLFFLKSAIYRV